MKNYYKKETEVAKLRLELIKEAIGQRLQNITITAAEFALYADLLQDAESSAATSEKRYQEEISKEDKE